MKFYDETMPLYIEMDASGVGLEAAYYKQEAVQGAPGMKHQTKAYSNPLHLPVQCGKKIQQHRKRNTRYKIWT